MLDYKFQEEAVDAMMPVSVGQIILPTGTGKSKIQERYLHRMITENPGFGIYVIVTPRILLTNQLMKDVSWGLLQDGIVPKRVTIHSGKEVDFADAVDSADKAERIKLLKQLNSQGSVIATTKAVLQDEVQKAKAENAPVLICSTYHSVDRVYKALNGVEEINAVLCDESQYVVQDDFHKSVAKVNSISFNTFFFTATQKRTASDDGLGHNNAGFYGDVIFTRTPREMIDTGYIVRPRLHLVEVSATSDEGTVDAVTAAYKEHKGNVNGDPKMLVVCKGSKQLNEIVSSPKFKTFARQQGKNFKVFDASSEFGFNVNGDSIKREEFLEQLRAHTGAAIVFHINMLAEGINVPDMSGVLPLINLKKTKFLQTLGRTTRLHPDDRQSFVAGDYGPAALDTMMKPYAYVILPMFTDEGADRTADIQRIVGDLRDHGFDPAEDVVIRKQAGVVQVEPIDLTTPPNEAKTGTLFSTLFDIHQSIEDVKIASLMNSGDKDKQIEALFA